MDFEWDVNKAESNEKKHGISFLEAASIYGDPLELTINDPDHSRGEFRFLSIWTLFSRKSSGSLLH